MSIPSTHALEFPVDDGCTVSAIAVEPSPMASTLVLAHDAGAGMEYPFMVAVAQGLAERRIGSLRVEFPYMQADKRRVVVVFLVLQVGGLERELPGSTLLVRGRI